MSTLSQNEKITLENRGVEVRSDGSSSHFVFSTSGICWIFNYSYSGSERGGTSISLTLLKKLAAFQPIEKSWRSLKIKANALPVYDNNEYFEIVFYLEGSPPRSFLSFPPSISNVPRMLNVPCFEHGVLKIRNNQLVQIQFSEKEVIQLNNGEVVTVLK